MRGRSGFCFVPTVKQPNCGNCRSFRSCINIASTVYADCKCPAGKCDRSCNRNIAQCVCINLLWALESHHFLFPSNNNTVAQWRAESCWKWQGLRGIQELSLVQRCKSSCWAVLLERWKLAIFPMVSKTLANAEVPSHTDHTVTCPTFYHCSSHLTL